MYHTGREKNARYGLGLIAEVWSLDSSSAIIDDITAFSSSFSHFASAGLSGRKQKI